MGRIPLFLKEVLPMAADIATTISFAVLVAMKLLTDPFLTEFLEHLSMSRFDRGFFYTPTITLLGMNCCMARFAQGNEVTSVMSSTHR